MGCHMGCGGGETQLDSKASCLVSELRLLDIFFVFLWYHL